MGRTRRTPATPAPTRPEAGPPAPARPEPARPAARLASRSGGPLVAPALFIVGAVSQYAGAAAAVLLFREVPAAGVAWLRVAAAAAVLLAWRRPWRSGWPVLRPAVGGAAVPRPAALPRGSGLRRAADVVAFGAVLAGMNLCFYLSIERLPLGTAVAIEFLGPVMVAAVGSRTRRDVGAFVCAAAGVALLAEVTVSGAGPGALAGVGFALAAAGQWALYIVLGWRVAAGGRGVDGLAVGMLAGALVIAPVALPPALPALADPRLAALCLGVGVLSSVVPYVLDQLVLARVGTGRFALLLALLPATAAVVGLVVLGQVPGVAETVGITLVVLAVAVRSPS